MIKFNIKLHQKTKLQASYHKSIFIKLNKKNLDNFIGFKLSMYEKVLFTVYIG